MRDNKKGFTLIELILYIAIVSVIMIAFADFAFNLAHARAKSKVIGEVEYNAGLMMDRMNDAIRHADGVNTGSSTFDADPGVLSVSMVDIGVDPTVFSLTADDGVFQVSEAGGGATPITTEGVSVTNLVFTDLTSVSDVGIVQVEFTVTANNPGNNPYYDYAQSYQTTLRIPLDTQ